MTRRPVLLAVMAAIVVGAPARAVAAPVYDVKATWGNTDLPPGGQGQFEVQARNLSTETGSQALTIVDRLPVGVTAKAVRWYYVTTDLAPADCSGVGTGTVSCVLSGSEVTQYAPGRGRESGLLGGGFGPSGYLPTVEVEVDVAAGVAASGTNTVSVSGGGAAGPVSVSETVPFGPVPSSFGLVPGSFQSDLFEGEYPFGAPSRQAGAHPFEQRVDFDITARTVMGEEFTKVVSDGPLQTVEYELPVGLTGNPEALPKCSPVQFAEEGSSKDSTGCPADTQVGYLNVALPGNGQATGLGIPNHLLAHTAIYNMSPPKGRLADFAFNANNYVQGHIYAALDPARDYAITTLTPEVSALVMPRGAEVTFWGVPGDPAHDGFRYYPKQQSGNVVAGAPFEGGVRPFFTNPMDCGVENGGARIRVASYAKPRVFTPTEESASHDNVEGCSDPRFRFEPGISLEPTDRHAGAPTGLEVKLKVPQRNDQVENSQELYAQNGNVKAIATPPIKKTVVTLPEGMTLNPSAGQGLSGCSLEQLGMSAAGVPNGEPVRCPDSAQIGTLVMHSPDLPENEPLTGRVYVAKQGENPFGSLFALYLVLENAERGLLVKLAGKIELDPVTGKITTTFDDLPQFPVSDFQLKFKSGPRAALVNPSTCGRKAITAEYYSWQDPNTPHTATDYYEVTQNPDGSHCVYSTAEWPFTPVLSAGTLERTAGAFAPFTLRLTRGDTEQQLAGLSLTLPPGLSGKLAGLQECPDANIQAAMALDYAGQGVVEQAHPSCPAGSQIGESLVSAGTGPSLSYVPGKVYFAGPYKGAPFSVVVITPSVVGPYDLGVVTVRNALYIDPTTAQVHVVSDPLPKILDGIFVRIRDLRIDINRPGFIFNPTNCAEQQITGSASAFEGGSATFSQRFQAANCQSLAFKPKFTVSTSGKTSRKDGASLNVKLVYPKAAFGTQANIHYAKVSLPKQLPSELKTLQHACPHEVFETNPAACPSESRVGTARATTPILPVPVEGPAYFVSYGGEKFPELIMVLQGYGVTIDLHGETFINEKTGITSSTLHNVPDVPVETFELTLPQGPFSALGANGNLCEAGKTVTVKKRVRKRVHGRMRTVTVKAKKKLPGLIMPTHFIAQNGADIKQNTPIAVTGCPKAHPKKGRKRKK